MRKQGESFKDIFMVVMVNERGTVGLQQIMFHSSTMTHNMRHHSPVSSTTCVYRACQQVAP